jgi:hypothetical protein
MKNMSPVLRFRFRPPINPELYEPKGTSDVKLLVLADDPRLTLIEVILAVHQYFDTHMRSRSGGVTNRSVSAETEGSENGRSG